MMTKVNGAISRKSGIARLVTMTITLEFAIPKL